MTDTTPEPVPEEEPVTSTEDDGESHDASDETPEEAASD